MKSSDTNHAVIEMIDITTAAFVPSVHAATKIGARYSIVTFISEPV
jgi:hypothetical protein